MKTLTKTRNLKTRMLDRERANISKKHRKEETQNALTLFNQRFTKQPGRHFKPHVIINKHWMRDWMEQLNFLRVDPVILDLAENDYENMCYYADVTDADLNK